MNAINTGDTAFMLVAAALVMFMTPGLALFYGGMVRNKNVLGTIMQSFIALGIISLLWVTFGYSLVFGPDKFGLIVRSNTLVWPSWAAPPIPILRPVYLRPSSSLTS